MMALSLIPVIAALAVGGEVTNWYLLKRNMQNAADSAAIAGAINGSSTVCTTTADFCYEARAVAARYGFTNGAQNVTVTPSIVNCPSPSTLTNCVQVVIEKKVPLYLSGIVGFQGDTTIGGSRAQYVRVSAIASGQGLPDGYCMIALGSSGNSFTLNGGPNADLTGCDLFSNGSMKCNGNSLPSSPYGDAVGTSDCGATPRGSQPTLTDPYLYLGANPPIPAPPSPCDYASKQDLNGPVLATTSVTWNGISQCGDVRLTSDVTVTTPNTVLSIYMGHLDLNGHTLSTSGSGSLTIIFTGTPVSGGSTTYDLYPINSTGTGKIDIAAPNSGTLSGVAIMQDNRLVDTGGSKLGLDVVYHGNDPTFAIQGLLYFPNADVTISGAINLHTDGLTCIGIVGKTVTISGTASIFAGNTLMPTSQCLQAGLTLPGVPGTNARQALMQ